MPDTLAILVIALAVAVFGLLAVGVFFMVRDTIRQRGRWGICLSQPQCHKCGEPVPLVRKPAHWRQAMWGGWTCTQCGFELDKFGHPVEDQPFPAKWSANLGDPSRRPTAAPTDPHLQKPDSDFRRGGDNRD